MQNEKPINVREINEDKFCIRLDEQALEDPKNQENNSVFVNSQSLNKEIDDPALQDPKSQTNSVFINS